MLYCSTNSPCQHFRKCVENSIDRDRAASFRVGGGGLFLAPLFLLNYFLVNSFLFLQKSRGGAKVLPAPPSVWSLMENIHTEVGVLRVLNFFFLNLWTLDSK